MGKRSSIKRLSSITQSASDSIDIKARKRIEQLYELTDEIVNAYDEINEKYIHQIYRKYQQLKEINKNLKDQLNRHHCTGCKCPVQPTEDDAVDDKNEQSTEEEEEDNNDDEETKNSAVPSSTTSSVITRSRKKNPFIISDIEETQNFDGNDSRFNQNSSDDADKTSMDTNENTHKTAKNNNESEEEEEEQEQEQEQEEQEEDNEEEEEEADEDNSMARLPLALQNVIQKKAKKNRNAKAYLLDIPRYPALCQYLRDKSTSSFDRRPNEDQIRPLIKNHLSKYLVNDSKLRKRVRDELREIHRSYMRTFMNDPHTTAPKSYIRKNKKLTVKKSPM